MGTGDAPTKATPATTDDASTLVPASEPANEGFCAAACYRPWLTAAVTMAVLASTEAFKLSAAAFVPVNTKYATATRVRLNGCSCRNRLAVAGDSVGTAPTLVMATAEAGRPRAAAMELARALRTPLSPSEPAFALSSVTDSATPTSSDDACGPVGKAVVDGVQDGVTDGVMEGVCRP